MNVELFQSVLQYDCIHDSRQHANIVGCRSIHVSSALRDSAKDVSTAHNDSDLDSQVDDCLYLTSNRTRDINVDAVVLFTHQRFAGKLQKYPLVGQALRCSFRLRRAHLSSEFDQLRRDDTSLPKSSVRRSIPSPILYRVKRRIVMRSPVFATFSVTSSLTVFSGCFTKGWSISTVSS